MDELETEKKNVEVGKRELAHHKERGARHEMDSNEGG